MATAPIWFDANYYLNIKADQLNAIGYGGKSDWTAASTEAAFTQQNISAYDHFVAFGKAENISPNAMFNVAEYLASKAAQLNATKFEGRTTWTEAEVMAAFDKAGISAWDHYTQFGMVEGVNPSNQFDTSAYLAAKLDALQKAEPTANWTMDSMLAVFKAGNINPLEHFQLYGKTEGITAPAVAPTEKVVTSFDPYAPASDGTTYTLTTAADNFTGTEKNDVFNGVLSSVSAEGTLNNTDKMDGAAGTADTLNVNMKGDFRGFTTGSMTNIEKVNLTNDTALSHSFSAKGVSGVDTWNLNAKGAAINLSDLSSAEGVTVNVLGQQTGTTTIAFDAKAVEGTKDSLNLGLNGVGTNPDKVVTVKAAEIENLHVKATGDNFVNLAGAAKDSITVNGTGNLDVEAVNSTLTTFDASALSGSVTADLTAAKNITTIKGGAGNDHFDIAGLGAKAVIDGGAGRDILTLENFNGPFAPTTMSGIEHVVVDGGTVTLVGTNVTGLDTISVEGTGSVTTSGLDAAALTLNALGNAAITKATITESTVLTYNTVAEKDALINAIAGEVLAAKATAATVNIGQHTQTSTKLTLAAAETVTLNVDSSKGAAGSEDTWFAGSVDAAKAQSLVVNAKGWLGDGPAATATKAATFNVNAAKSVTVTAEQGGKAEFNAAAATDVSITAGKGLDITDSDFAKAQNVTLVQNDGTLSGDADFTALNVLNVSGAGKDSKVALGDLGHTSLDHELTINASGLAKGFTSTGINSGTGNMTLNFGEVTGAIATGALESKGTVTVNAAGMGTTTIGTINATAQAAAGDVTINAMGVLGGSKTAPAVETGNITAGTDKAVNISFDGGTDMKFGAITVGGTKGVININAAEYTAIIGHTADGAKAEAVFSTVQANTVNIKGSATSNNTFMGSAPNLFDQSAIKANTLDFTGGLGVDTISVRALSGTAMDVTLNTGLGDDKVTVNASSDTKTITMHGDLGGNTGDKVSVAGAANLDKLDISGLANYGLLTAYLDTKALVLTGSTGNDNIALTSITGKTTLAAELNTGTGDDEVKVDGIAATTTITLTGNMGDGADTVAITGAAGLTEVNIAGLVGYESSIITSELSTAATQTFKTGVGADTINVKAAATPTDFKVALETGAGNDTVTITANAATTAITVTGKMGTDAVDHIAIVGGAATATIDLSGLSEYATSDISGIAVAATITGGKGADTIHGGEGVDTIKGGEGNDIIYAGKNGATVTAAVVDILSGGAGNDLFIVSGVTTGSKTSSELKATSQVTDFSGTDDSLAFTGGVAGSSTNTVALTKDTLTDLAAEAVGKLNATVLYAYGTASDGKVYVFHGTGAADGVTDAVVELTGVAAGTFDFHDIVAGV